MRRHVTVLRTIAETDVHTPIVYAAMFGFVYHVRAPLDGRGHRSIGTTCNIVVASTSLCNVTKDGAAWYCCRTSVTDA
jgi:hypothetical protein